MAVICGTVLGHVSVISMDCSLISLHRNRHRRQVAEVTTPSPGAKKTGKRKRESADVVTAAFNDPDHDHVHPFPLLAPVAP